jgi:hypothetical protein
VSVVFRIAEVEERIEDQREEMAKAVLHVMDLIDLLPPNSMSAPWWKCGILIARNGADRHGGSHVKVPDYRLLHAALDTLLTYKRTGKLVGDFVADRENVDRRANKKPQV